MTTRRPLHVLTRVELVFKFSGQIRVRPIIRPNYVIIRPKYKVNDLTKPRNPAGLRVIKRVIEIICLVGNWNCNVVSYYLERS